MKICLIGIAGLKPGKHNLKDPRLDQAHKLVEADKKVYAQVDLVGEDDLSDADAIVVSAEHSADLILKDLEFVETRLNRDPEEPEKTALTKIQAILENEQFISKTDLSPADLEAVEAHSFCTTKPIIIANKEDLENPDQLFLKAFQESGYICFLTVGGQENRAWPIQKGISAAEAAASIHTDLQKGFIRAEVINYEDFLDAGGETQAKRAGKLRLEMKPYVVQDYDLINFRCNK